MMNQRTIENESSPWTCQECDEGEEEEAQDEVTASALCVFFLRIQLTPLTRCPRRTVTMLFLTKRCLRRSTTRAGTRRRRVNFFVPFSVFVANSLSEFDLRPTLKREAMVLRPEFFAVSSVDEGRSHCPESLALKALLRFFCVFRMKTCRHQSGSRPRRRQT